jgi:hypothetical protein
MTAWQERWQGALMSNYGTPPVLLVRGQGSRVWDADGREYVDLLAGIAVMLLILWGDTKTNVTGFLGRMFGAIDVRMNTAFYGFLSAGLGFLLALVFVNTRFNYYEVNAREILHHHGYLGDIQRWSTEGLEMNKEIYDVVEFLLLRSGRLIFQPATAKKAIVLDNVANVNRIEKQVNDLLSVVAVRLNQQPGPG